MIQVSHKINVTSIPYAGRSVEDLKRICAEKLGIPYGCRCTPVVNGKEVTPTFIPQDNANVDFILRFGLIDSKQGVISGSCSL